MRQRLGPKKVAKYARQTGLDLVGGLVRGGTDHRVDLHERGGLVWSLYKDGTLQQAFVGEHPLKHCDG